MALSISLLKINKANAAISLMELLVSLALGAFLLLFVMTPQYAHFVHTQNKQNTLFALQQASHQILNYFRLHIENINYLAKGENESNITFFSHPKSYHLEKNCLMFVYDLDNDGCIGTGYFCHKNGKNNAREVNKEIFGFKLHNQEIYLYKRSQEIKKCTVEECQQILESCNDQRDWVQYTYRNQYLVEKLEFKWIERAHLMAVEMSLKKDNVKYANQALIYLLNHEE